MNVNVSVPVPVPVPVPVLVSQADTANWPPVLQKLVQHAATGAGGAQQQGQLNAELSLRALGGCVSYLKQQLIDREMVALKNFQSFMPVRERETTAASVYLCLCVCVRMCV
eukprot:COSAG05_NODE_1660_length_4322_cov_319.432394_1_plen_111_part_00